MNSTQTVDHFETYGVNVTGEVTAYAGETLENLNDEVDLTDGDQVLRNVRVTSLTVVELGDESSVFRFRGMLRKR